MDRPAHTIQICMGSSCFSRGNGLNAELIQRLIDTAAIDAEWSETKLAGTLCAGLCKEGPIVIVDEVVHSHVTPTMLQELLRVQKSA